MFYENKFIVIVIVNNEQSAPKQYSLPFQQKYRGWKSYLEILKNTTNIKDKRVNTLSVEKKSTALFGLGLLHMHNNTIWIKRSHRWLPRMSGFGKIELLTLELNYKCIATQDIENTIQN